MFQNYLRLIARRPLEFWQSDIALDYLCSGVSPVLSNDAGLLSLYIVGVRFHVEQACLAQCTYVYVCCEIVNAW